jgi:opacity protein-like surface antigen
MIFGYRLDKSVSLQTGLLFDRKGYALNDTSFYYHRIASDTRYVSNKVDTKIALDYLTVPLNFRISSGKTVNFYVDFGAYAGFLVNAFCHGTAIRKNSDSYSYTIQKTIVNDAVEGYYKSVDWGYKTGLGFQFPFMDNMKFDFGISYYGSFNPILQKPDAYTTNYMVDDLSVKNGSLSLKFGIQIPIAN